MLTLDGGVTLQPIRGEMHSCISPGAGNWIYCESVTVPPYLPSTTTCTSFALLQKSITSSSFFSFPFFFIFYFFSFMEQFTLPCSQPALLASEEAEWGEAWALCTSVISASPLHPLPLSREYWVSSPCSSGCRKSCSEQAELEQPWDQSWGREGGDNPPFLLYSWLGTSTDNVWWVASASCANSEVKACVQMR